MRMCTSDLTDRVYPSWKFTARPPDLLGSISNGLYFKCLRPRERYLRRDVHASHALLTEGLQE
jgi:hypothetical protein